MSRVKSEAFTRLVRGMTAHERERRKDEKREKIVRRKNAPYRATLPRDGDVDKSGSAVYIAPTGEIALVKALFHVRILALAVHLAARGTGSSTASTPTRRCSRAEPYGVTLSPCPRSLAPSPGLRLPPRYPRVRPEPVPGSGNLKDSLSPPRGGKFEFHGVLPRVVVYGPSDTLIPHRRSRSIATFRDYFRVALPLRASLIPRRRIADRDIAYCHREV